MKLMIYAVTFSLTLATTTDANIHAASANGDKLSEIFIANMETGTLTIKWGKETTVLSDMVGSAGQTTRALLSFNDGPALSYENSGSNTNFEVFYTITFNGKEPVIDCVYGNIRNGLNGVSIRKAVCDLQQPLTSNYQDLIFTYSDAWIESSNRVSLQSVMEEPSEPAVTPLGQLGEVDVALRYDSVEDLMSASPKTIATLGEKTREITVGNAYLVYEVDGITPLALDVETDPVAHSLKRLTPTELSLGVEAN